LTDKDYENLKLYGVLARFTHRGDCDRDILREKLIDAELEKEKIREVIDKMADLRITSKYRGLSSEAPFSIKDEHRYEDWLEKNLIEPVIGALSERPKRVKEEETIKEEKEVVKDITDVKGVIKPTIPPPSDLKIFLGEDENEKEIFWEPKKENNWSFVIVGSAGTGKTQTVKAVLSEFVQSKLPYIIFDFRNDYISKAKGSDFGQILDLNTISINPLELDGNNTPKDQKYQISDIVDLVYNIGERQVGCRVPKLFRQEVSPKRMVKLTDKKIKWAVNQVINKGESTAVVAAIYGVSRRRIQQLVREEL